MRFRGATSSFIVVALVAGIVTAVEMTPSAPHLASPASQAGTAAGKPHRVSAAVTHGFAASGSTRLPGTALAGTPVKPLHLPVRSKAEETLRVEPAPKAAPCGSPPVPWN